MSAPTTGVYKHVKQLKKLGSGAVYSCSWTARLLEAGFDDSDPLPSLLPNALRGAMEEMLSSI